MLFRSQIPRRMVPRQLHRTADTQKNQLHNSFPYILIEIKVKRRLGGSSPLLYFTSRKASNIFYHRRLSHLPHNIHHTFPLVKYYSRNVSKKPNYETLDVLSLTNETQNNPVMLENIVRISGEVIFFLWGKWGLWVYPYRNCSVCSHRNTRD